MSPRGAEVYAPEPRRSGAYTASPRAARRGPASTNQPAWLCKPCTSTSVADGGEAGRQTKPVDSPTSRSASVDWTSSSIGGSAPLQAEHPEVGVHLAAQARDLGLVVHDGVLADVLDEAHGRALVQLEDLRVLESERRALVGVLDVDLAETLLEQVQQVGQL